MPSENKIYYKRNLPHYQPPGGTFFVTFRLKDSIPIPALKRLLQEQEEERLKFDKEEPTAYEQADFYLNQVYAYDNLLDQIKSGPTYLQEPAVANIVADRLKEFDGQLYDLLSYCIMPNHVHILIDTSIQLGYNGKVPESYVQLHEIMRLLKGGTAVKANRIIGRTGGFWQKESYDHWVRNSISLMRILAYIMENPCKAKLVKRWQDWKYSFVKGFGITN